MKKLISCALCFMAYTTFAKYNFLFIAVDDLRPELNCFEASHIISPNIDKLASQGRVFTNHFVQVPTCGASRASMLVGRYPRVTDALSHSFAKNHVSALPEGESPESFPHLLRRNGYYTISIGKVSHSYDGYLDASKTKPEFPYSWDERHLEKGKWENAQKAYEKFDESESKKKNKAAPFECASNDVKFPDELNTDLAISKLDELKAKDKPFMLAIGYFKPHLPFNSSKKFWDLYDEDTIALAEQKGFGDIALEFGHNSGEFNTYSFDGNPSQSDIMSDAHARKIRHAYYACVSATDYQIGRLLNALKEKGLAENTIVVLWGDHGWQLGENAIWGKHSLFKKSLNSPLIISVPNMNAKGVKTDSIVESVDLYPTFCDFANIDLPKHIDGTSLKTIIENPSAEVKDFAVSFWKNNKNQQIGIHSKTESLMAENLLEDGEILAYFDFTKDPLQSKSLEKVAPERTKVLRASIVEFLKKHEITYPFARDDTEKAKSSSKKSSKDGKKGSKKSGEF